MIQEQPPDAEAASARAEALAKKQLKMEENAARSPEQLETERAAWRDRLKKMGNDGASGATSAPQAKKWDGTHHVVAASVIQSRYKGYKVRSSAKGYITGWFIKHHKVIHGSTMTVIAVVISRIWMDALKLAIWHPLFGQNFSTADLVWEYLIVLLSGIVIVSLRPLYNSFRMGGNSSMTKVVRRQQSTSSVGAQVTQQLNESVGFLAGWLGKGVLDSIYGRNSAFLQAVGWKTLAVHIAGAGATLWGATIVCQAATAVAETTKRRNPESRAALMSAPVVPFMMIALSLAVSGAFDICLSEIILLDSYLVLEEDMRHAGDPAAASLPPAGELSLLWAVTLNVFCALLNTKLEDAAEADLFGFRRRPHAKGACSCCARCAFAVGTCVRHAWHSARTCFIPLVQKALGFLLGQAWYDVATRAYPDYAETMTGRLAVTLFATVACLLALTAFNGANKKALSERDMHEAKMLTSALAMVQGWLWCDAVDVGLDAWRGYVPVLAKELYPDKKLVELRWGLSLLPVLVTSVVLVWGRIAMVARLERMRKEMFIGAASHATETRRSAAVMRRGESGSAAMV